VGDKISITALPNAKVLVNGKALKTGVARELAHRDRVLFGNNHIFLMVFPGRATSEKADASDASADPAAAFTWEDAMNEVNESQISTLTEGERLAREQAEREAKEMQAKVVALEERMKEERRRAEEEARAATDAEREKMIEKQRQLEAALQAQIDSTNRKQARKEKEQRKRQVLEGHILRTLPLVSEANAIAEELGKQRTFAIQLVATQNTANGSLGSGDEAVDQELIASSLETSVWIRVDSSESEVPIMWDLEKFVNRLYLMREMYEDFVESNRDMAEVEKIYGQEYDPFFDPDEEQLIGKAYVMLTPLGFFINIEDNPPIIQYQGKTDGALQISISIDEDQVEKFENLDAEEERTLADVIGDQLKLTVAVTAARGLPRQLSQAVTVSYRFFNISRRTPACSKTTINPRFDHVDKFSLAITNELVRYIQNEPIEFQVWGTPSGISSPVPNSPGNPAVIASSEQKQSEERDDDEEGDSESESDRADEELKSGEEKQPQSPLGEGLEIDAIGRPDKSNKKSSKKKRKGHKHRRHKRGSSHEQAALEEAKEAALKAKEELATKLQETQDELAQANELTRTLAEEKSQLSKALEETRRALKEQEDSMRKAMDENEKRIQRLQAETDDRIEELNMEKQLLEGTVKLQDESAQGTGGKQPTARAEQESGPAQVQEGRVVNEAEQPAMKPSKTCVVQ